MGAGQSSEKVIHNETRIQFAEDLVNHLSDEVAAPDTHPHRQSMINDHVRSRIRVEMARLREEEEGVRAEIERALERENIDRERASAVPGRDADADADEGSADGRTPDGAVRASLSLREDVREVQRRVERLQKRREMDDVADVKAASEVLVECYRKNPRTPLNCWKEVSEFKESVAQAEQKFVDSLR